MKFAWTRRMGLMVAGLILCLGTAVADDNRNDPFTVSYYHRFAGSGGPLPVVNYNYLSPYQYESFIQSKRGIEFGFQSLPTMTLHARVEQQFNSDHYVARDWQDSAIYTFVEEKDERDFSTHFWQITLDAIFEPLKAQQDGPVRAVVGVGPFISLMSDDYNYKSSTTTIDPTGYFSSSRTEETGTSLLVGLRGILGAEWWFKNRIAIVCQTGFEACIFTSNWDEENRSSYENPDDSGENWSKDSHKESGWQIYNQPVMFGVRVSF